MLSAAEPEPLGEESFLWKPWKHTYF
jgi:hypothetical protein